MIVRLENNEIVNIKNFKSCHIRIEDEKSYYIVIYFSDEEFFYLYDHKDRNVIQNIFDMFYLALSQGQSSFWVEKYLPE